MTPFQEFMNGLKSDCRLGVLFADGLAEQSPEVIILTLALRLADSREGRNEHPAWALLERLQHRNTHGETSNDL